MRPSWPDALSAIRWACAVAGNPGRPYSSRMLDAWREGGDATDAAGQAGMIFRRLWELRGAPMASLVARAVPPRFKGRCRHCGSEGRLLNPDWKESIDVLAAAALVAKVGGKSYNLRVALLHRFYAGHQSYRQIAQEVSREGDAVDDATAARYGKALKAWLGAREKGDASDPKEGIEPAAFRRATELLTEAGLIS